MADQTLDRTRQMAEDDLEGALFLRNIFVLTMLGVVAFIATTAYVLLGH